MVLHVCKSSIWEDEACLGYMVRPVSKTNGINEREKKKDHDLVTFSPQPGKGLLFSQT